MAEKKTDGGADPLELLKRLDAGTLDTAIAEQKAVVQTETGKLRQLQTLRRSIAMREMVKQPRKKREHKPDEQPASPPPPTPQQMSDRDLNKIRMVLTRGPSPITEVAAKAGVPMDRVAEALQANLREFVCRGQGVWALR